MPNLLSRIAPFLFFLLWLPTTQAQLVDRIALVVNETPVLLNEFKSHFRESVLVYQQRNLTLNYQEIFDETIELIVKARAQIDMAKRMGIKVNENSVNQRLNQIALEEKISLVELTEVLANQYGSVENYRKKIEETLTIQQLQQINISNRVQITDAEVVDFLATERGRELIKISYSFVYTRAEDNTYQIANEIMAQELTPSEIVAQLEQQSFFTRYLAGTPINRLPTVVQEIIPKLAIGEVSSPIKYEDSWHMVKVSEMKGITPQNQELVNSRHILLIPNLIRNKEQTRLELESLREEILNGKSFSQMAFLYSEDQGTRSEGGDLGWQPYSAFTPKFSVVVKELPLDVVSEPFETPFGFHLVERLGIKLEDVSAQNQLNKARDIIFQEKIEDELPRWLSEIKNSAFVDVKISLQDVVDI